jgi:hypothetical protein
VHVGEDIARPADDGADQQVQARFWAGVVGGAGCIATDGRELAWWWILRPRLDGLHTDGLTEMHCTWMDSPASPRCAMVDPAALPRCVARRWTLSALLRCAACGCTRRRSSGSWSHGGRATGRDAPPLPRALKLYVGE